MAITAISTVGHQILIHEGHTGPETMRTNGTDIKPGMVVTSTGETILLKDIDIPGAVDEVVAGIVGLLPNHDIDTAYADNTAVPVYTKGSGAVCWGWNTAGDGDKFVGAPLMHSHAGANGFTLAGELVNEYVGVAYVDTVVDATNDTPIQIQLV